jgi:hypothetical protein
VINIRYHIVSLTAVVLALGLGVALGGTFLEGTTIDLLERNIDSAEARIDRTEAENDRLQAETDAARQRDQALLEGATLEVADRLADRPVLVIAPPDVDQVLVDGVRTVVQNAGADLRGTLELRDPMAFAGDLDEGLVEELDLEATTPDEAREETFELLSDALRGAGITDDVDAGTSGPAPEDPPATTAATTEPGPGETSEPGEAPDLGSGDDPVDPDGEQPEVLTALLSRGYAQVVPGPGHDVSDPLLETTGYLYVLVSAPGIEEASNRMLVDLLPAGPLGDLAPIVLVTQPAAPLPEDLEVPPDAVAQVRANPTQGPLYATVDNADTYAGLVATVRALQDLDHGGRGHYGQGDGATAVLPPGP